MKPWAQTQPATALIRRFGVRLFPVKTNRYQFRLLLIDFEQTTRWLSVAYSMTAAACLRLAAVHLLVWFKQRARRPDMALSRPRPVVTSRLSLRWARAQTPDQYVQALRRFHISAALMIGSMDAHSSSTVSIVVSDTGSAFIAGAGDDGALCDLSDRAGLIRT
jgi:hypothetical protein